MTKAEFLRKAIQAAHVMDLDDYRRAFGLIPYVYEYGYHEERWQLQQKNFALWYCQLTEVKQELFCQWVEEQN